MKKLERYLIFVVLISIANFNVSAERIRLDRKHGAVNSAFQEILSEQISKFDKGQGKIELGRSGDKSSSCTADLFVSPDTIFVVVESKKNKSRAEFYVDHPKDSFKDVLFQALVKQGEQSVLSVDKKIGSYKFSKNGGSLLIEVKQQGKLTDCKFDLQKATLVSGSTE